MGKRGEEMQTQVLRVLRRKGAPMSAYQVLGELQIGNPRLAPTTIYRALEKLVERGSAHRLESLNAFIVCQCEGQPHTSVMSICEDCGAVEETPAIKVLEQLSSLASKSGFSPKRHVVEVHGRCASCCEEEERA